MRDIVHEVVTYRVSFTLPNEGNGKTFFYTKEEAYNFTIAVIAKGGKILGESEHISRYRM